MPNTDTSSNSTAAKELAEVLLNTVNTSLDSDATVSALTEGHPHLQNELYFELVRPLIEGLAETPRHDARNNAAVNECREILATMEWN